MEPESYHLEKHNLEPMLGFLNQNLLSNTGVLYAARHSIWVIIRRLCRSNGGHICCFRAESRLSFLDLFLRPSRESTRALSGSCHSNIKALSNSQMPVSSFLMVVAWHKQLCNGLNLRRTIYIFLLVLYIGLILLVFIEANSNNKTSFLFQLFTATVIIIYNSVHLTKMGLICVLDTRLELTNGGSYWGLSLKEN